MYRVYFWNYSKKTNSTSHPSVTGSVDHYDCSLMDLSGILTPTLQLNGRNPTAFNYAYIEDFHRYYYVSNWRYGYKIVRSLRFAFRLQMGQLHP